jgi:hypothetical protein
VSRTAGWCAQAVLACAAVWTGAALADEGPFTPGSSTQLTLDHYSETFSYPDGPRTFDVSEYSVGYYEPVAEDVALGLQGGYLTINVDNDKLASLIAYSGQFLGFMGRYQSTWGDYLNFAAEIRYLWHDQQGQLSGQQSDITWYETYARAGPVLRYGPLRFELGGYYQNNSGKTSAPMAAVRTPAWCSMWSPPVRWPCTATAARGTRYAWSSRGNSISRAPAPVF